MIVAKKELSDILAKLTDKEWELIRDIFREAFKNKDDTTEYPAPWCKPVPGSCNRKE